MDRHGCYVSAARMSGTQRLSLPALWWSSSTTRPGQCCCGQCTASWTTRRHTLWTPSSSSTTSPLWVRHGHGTVQHSTTQCNTIQYNVTSIIQHAESHLVDTVILFDDKSTVGQSWTRHSTTQYNTTQYNTTQCNTIQYNVTSIIQHAVTPCGHHHPRRRQVDCGSVSGSWTWLIQIQNTLLPVAIITIKRKLSLLTPALLINNLVKLSWTH